MTPEQQDNEFAKRRAELTAERRAEPITRGELLDALAQLASEGDGLARLAELLR